MLGQILLCHVSAAESPEVLPLCENPKQGCGFLLAIVGISRKRDPDAARGGAGVPPGLRPAQELLADEDELDCLFCVPEASPGPTLPAPTQQAP